MEATPIDQSLDREALRFGVIYRIFEGFLFSRPGADYFDRPLARRVVAAPLLEELDAPDAAGCFSWPPQIEILPVGQSLETEQQLRRLADIRVRTPGGIIGFGKAYEPKAALGAASMLLARVGR